MALLRIAYIVAAFLVVGTFQTQFDPCKDSPSPVSLSVDGCEKFPCPLVRGTTLHAKWSFLVTKDTETLKPEAKATALGVTVNYPLPQKDACKGLENAECPLEEGELVTYHLEMPILKMYPKVPLTVQFSLIDEHGDAQVCFKVDAKVTD